MNFGQQIKSIREQNKLTQDAMAEKLMVTRQAISNWENDKNLPDIEMLIMIAETFGVSLDDLILGGRDMNNMTEKLIKDGSEGRRARNNMISVAIGAVFMVLGIALIVIKACSVEYVDASGVLHENFFLLPIAFLLFFAAFMTFLITGIRNTITLLRSNNGEYRKQGIVIAWVCFAVIAIMIAGFCFLVAANR